MTIQSDKRRGFSAFNGGDATVELVQRGLASIGFSVPISGIYDRATSDAVLEFRGAVGLPDVDRIDDAFMDRLWQEVDAAGNTANLPPGLKVGDRTQGEIGITGKISPASIGLGLLLLLGLLASKKKRRK